MSKRKREEDIRELTADEKSLINKVRAFDPPLSAYVTSAFITWIKESHSSTKSKFLNHAENANYLRPFLEILDACGAEGKNITSIATMVRTRSHLSNIVEKKEEATAILTFCIEQNILSSITGMQFGKGMISDDDFARLKNLFSDANGNLDKELLSSITGMQHGKGMISDDDFARLKNLCSDADGNLDKELLSSITGMQHCKGMPTNDDLVLMLRGNLDTAATSSSSSGAESSSSSSGMIMAETQILPPPSPQITATGVEPLRPPQQVRGETWV